jgi:hypothetical protein
MALDSVVPARDNDRGCPHFAWLEIQDDAFCYRLRPTREWALDSFGCACIPVPSLIFLGCLLQARRVFFLSPPGYPGNLPCPAKGAAIKSHNDKDQGTLQCGTPGVREERYSEAELY